MLAIASPRDIAAIAVAGRAVDAALRRAAQAVAPGVTSHEVACVAHEALLAAGAVPVLLGYSSEAPLGTGSEAPGGTGVSPVPSAHALSKPPAPPTARPSVVQAKVDAPRKADVRLAEGTGETPVPPGKRATQPFPAAACVCVHEQAVHGVPSARVLGAGEVVTIDVACAVADERGVRWHADAATTVVVPQRDAPGASASQTRNREHDHGHARAHALAALAHDATACAISLCQPGARWSAIVQRTREFVRERGGSLLAGYHGHGIGEQLHQAPTAWFERLPHEQDEASGRALPDFTLLPGMVLCIEPIVSLSKSAPTLVLASDGWSVLTRDRSPAAYVERCIAITRSGPRVLAG